MKKLDLRCFLIFLPLFSLKVTAQKDDVVITVDTLSNNVYMLTGQGGNIGIYVGKRMFIWSMTNLND
ncbi:hypothetical protein [Maribacter sp. 4U21]|uniref:hypothetical protein n=1 Tax=Maribacter sp. 4U21 TaxID=1889779 RepID=UPI00211F2826|nr:hypothetical protein [Maribacter sp. 4U21]